ncbi:hypothetical protein B0T25DRAFT_512750 [Lasiosphaeria hispida]|uniref:Uncharacterized protein n=1 Tax=Lasiosphaeria hispida TaxID=260671 RepID=A0AAJ0HTF5_9PEZI|nr:hypothetical protein B0T25DRAFT_512750 [Lasiosphaeria hispida]
MAGLLAFFEYQMHDLPPQQFKLLELVPPGEKIGLVGRVPPEPVESVEPRRPSSGDYPGPAQAKATHCGWSAPRLRRIVAEFGNEDYYGYDEAIPFVLNDDPSWCPCNINYQLGPNSALMPITTATSDDPGCNSVLQAIHALSVAHNTNWFTPHRDDVSYGVATLTKIPELRIRWPGPSTNPNGDVLLALEIRTVAPSNAKKPASADVFGNEPQPPAFTALYPAKLPYNPYETPSLSTVWWTLPLSRPQSTASATTTSNSSTGSATAATAATAAYSSTITATSSHDETGSNAAATPSSSREPSVKSSTPSTFRSQSVSSSSARSLPVGENQVTTTDSPSARPVTRSNPSSQMASAPGVEKSPSIKETSTIITTAGAQDANGTIVSVTKTYVSSYVEKPPSIVEETSIMITAANTQDVNGTIISATTTYVSFFTITAGIPTRPVALTPLQLNTTSPSDQNTSSTAFTPTNSSTPSLSPLHDPFPDPGQNPPIILPPGPIPPGAGAAFFNLRSETDFLMASLIPVLLATLLSVFVEVISSTLNAVLPFRALRYSGGATAEDSLLLGRGGAGIFGGPRIGVRFWRRWGDALPGMNVLLGWASVALVSLSGEVIRLEFTRSCGDGRGDGPARLRVCAFGLRKAGVPMRIAEGLLVVMMLLVVGMGVLVWRWRTGLGAEPWSVVGMASLISKGEFQSFVKGVHGAEGSRHLTEEEKNMRFGLGFYGASEERYGITIVNVSPLEDKKPIPILTDRDPRERKPVSDPHSSNTVLRRFCRQISPAPIHKETITQLSALVLTAGLLILILYYETITLNTAFEAFMDSQSFGVRILFTTFGIAVSGFWDFNFARTFDSHIHRRLSHPNIAPQHPRTSILLSPPHHIFSIFSQAWLLSIRTAEDVLSLNVATAALLAKFTPILLSNVPFRNTITWRMHEACTWMAVAVLAYMVLVLAASLMWRWCQRGRRSVLQVKPDTIVGCMAYVCDSEVVDDVQGLALLSGKERERLVGNMGRRYLIREVGGRGLRIVSLDFTRLGARGLVEFGRGRKG